MDDNILFAEITLIHLFIGFVTWKGFTLFSHRPEKIKWPEIVLRSLIILAVNAIFCYILIKMGIMTY